MDMRYDKFPRLNRWLEFEDHGDYENFQAKSAASWPLQVSGARARFNKLIERRAIEPEIHKFLEEHPYFLPGFDDLHHGPYGGIIATKLPLGNTFVTDFAFVACNSQRLAFTCVEIESARKRLFRVDGKLHRDYLDARQQISDWLFWAKQNSKEAIDCWGVLFNGRPASWYDIVFRGFLVFGRRSEIDTPVKQARWSAESASLDSNLHTMTYDRLLLNPRAIRVVDNDKIAVCSFRERRFFCKKGHLLI